jgi:predicted amino acid-binding ACT domain protein
MSQYTVIYTAGGINSTVNGSVSEITTAMRSRFQELANVSPTVDGETITFTVMTGSKAAQYTVVYVAGGINSTVNGSVSEITTAMRSRFQELANVSPTVNGEIITFTVMTGSKAV